MPAFIVVIILVLVGVFFGPSEEQERSSYSSSGYYSENRNERSIDYDEAREDYWDEIREYINGTYTVEVYSYESGNYYDLDADISNGVVEIIYFPNGGYIYIDAELNSDGIGEGYGSDSDWEVNLYDDSVIEEATEEWANDNGYDLN